MTSDSLCSNIHKMPETDQDSSFKTQLHLDNDSVIMKIFPHDYHDLNGYRMLRRRTPAGRGVLSEFPISSPNESDVHDS